MSACGCQSSPALGADHEDAGCSGGEAFALRVLGQSMAPEFSEGEIILIEPDGALRCGCYVLARSEGEYTFRQLLQEYGAALHPPFCGTPDRRSPPPGRPHRAVGAPRTCRARGTRRG